MKMIKLFHCLVILALGALTWSSWHQTGLVPSAEWGNFYLISTIGFALGCLISLKSGYTWADNEFAWKLGFLVVVCVFTAIPCYVLPLASNEENLYMATICYLALTLPILYFGWPKFTRLHP